MKSDFLIFSCILAIIFCGSLVNVANADTITETWSGTVTSGYDSVTNEYGYVNNPQTGLFGPPSPDLSRLSFTAVFTINESKSGVTNASNLPYFSAFGGGSTYSGPEFTSAVITINGHSVPVGGNVEGLIEEGGPQYYNEGFYTLTTGGESYQANNGDYIRLSDTVKMDFGCYAVVCGNFSAETGNLDAAQHYNFASYDYQGNPLYNFGYFSLINTNDSSGNRNQSFAFLSASSLDVSVLSVPEPSAWALALIGLFGVGVRIRLKRRENSWMISQCVGWPKDDIRRRPFPA